MKVTAHVMSVIALLTVVACGDDTSGVQVESALPTPLVSTPSPNTVASSTQATHAQTLPTAIVARVVPTQTETATPTPFPSLTPTLTPISTPQPTQPPTATKSPVPTPTATASQTPEPTATVTPTPTNTPAPTHTPLPTATATPTYEPVIFRDMFGRVVNDTGITLVDWEGYIANPAVKFSVEFPGTVATLSSSQPRLYFNLPSTVGANGPKKTVGSFPTMRSPEFLVSIYPDRDAVDESYTLMVKFKDHHGRFRSESIDIHVIDQDVEISNEFEIIVDYRHDTTGMFDDEGTREIVQQAADDFAYFIADMDLDEVRVGSERMWKFNPGGYNSGRRVTNRIAYTGFLLHAYGHPHDKLTAGGAPSHSGRNQSSGGVNLPIKRSGSINFHPKGNFNTLGWMTISPQSAWWGATNLDNIPNDLYSIALHEMGHALVFNPSHDGFAGFRKAGEISDEAVKEYFGKYPRVDRFDHLPGAIDPASRRGAYGNEYNGETPLGRWILTKLDLLIAQAVGYSLRDTSPFRRLSISEDPLVKGSMGDHYKHAIEVTGGIPAYFWEIESGALPKGLSLDSFTGTVSGIPLETGIFPFVVRVYDSSEGRLGATRAINLKVTN